MDEAGRSRGGTRIRINDPEGCITRALRFMAMRTGSRVTIVSTVILKEAVERALRENHGRPGLRDALLEAMHEADTPGSWAQRRSHVDASRIRDLLDQH